MTSRLAISPKGTLVLSGPVAIRLHNFKSENSLVGGNGQKQRPMRHMDALKRRVDKILQPLEAAKINGDWQTSANCRPTGQVLEGNDAFVLGVEIWQRNEQELALRLLSSGLVRDLTALKYLVLTITDKAVARQVLEEKAHRHLPPEAQQYLISVAGQREENASGRHGTNGRAKTCGAHAGAGRLQSA